VREAVGVQLSAFSNQLLDSGYKQVVSFRLSAISFWIADIKVLELNIGI